MAKLKLMYVCSDCGESFHKWQGQCSSCKAWDTLKEFREPANSKKKENWTGQTSAVVDLAEVSMEDIVRQSTGIAEFDRALGGGLVPGSISLLGGDPGIGKSTLLIQTASLVSTHPVLYVSGEESGKQINMRATRLGLDKQGIKFLAEVSCEKILDQLMLIKPAIAVIDSIQTIYSEYSESAPGSVSQVRECAAKLTAFAKTTGTCIILIGHVTKEGAVAGPRVLEHMVDTVLYFEGEAKAGFRLLRATKNRFGACGELGVFAMTEKGLVGVDNPSALFMVEHDKPVPGVAILSAMEGERSLLVEVQALIEETRFPSARKLAVGMDPNRVAMLIAVLGERCGASFADYNVYLNAVGGARVVEPAGDLAIVSACYSSLKKKAISGQTALFGEVGLAGELRPVTNVEQRIKEAQRLGFKRIIMPKYSKEITTPKGILLRQVSTLSEALALLYE